MTRAWREWLKTPAGAYMLAWEQLKVDDVVADIFGYHALQLGMSELKGLQTNRMPHQWLALPESDTFQASETFDFAAHSVCLLYTSDAADE